MGLKQDRLDRSAVKRRMAGGPARRLLRGQGQEREAGQPSGQELGPWAATAWLQNPSSAIY